MSGGAAGRARAWGWVAHLRAGGTTPWSRWSSPAEHRGWVAERGDRVAARLQRAGYPVDRGQWSGDGRAASGHTDFVTSGASGALGLALRLVLGEWQDQQ